MDTNKTNETERDEIKQDIVEIANQDEIKDDSILPRWARALIIIALVAIIALISVGLYYKFGYSEPVTRENNTQHEEYGNSNGFQIVEELGTFPKNCTEEQPSPKTIELLQSFFGEIKKFNGTCRSFNETKTNLTTIRVKANFGRLELNSQDVGHILYRFIEDFNDTTKREIFVLYLIMVSKFCPNIWSDLFEVYDKIMKCLGSINETVYDSKEKKMKIDTIKRHIAELEKHSMFLVDHQKKIVNQFNTNFVTRVSCSPPPTHNSSE